MIGQTSSSSRLLIYVPPHIWLKYRLLWPKATKQNRPVYFVSFGAESFGAIVPQKEYLDSIRVNEK